MKKIHYALAVTCVAVLTMCSKSSEMEEEIVPILGNEIVVDAAKMEKDVLDLVNEHRVSIGISTLVLSPSSYKYAKEHNDYMISENKLSHDNFNDRASEIAAETNATEIAENVARFYVTPKTVVDGWLKSTSHKETLEKPFTHTTLSVQLDKEGRPYFTQIFMTVENNN